jgi:hypothetical protein
MLYFSIDAMDPTGLDVITGGPLVPQPPIHLSPLPDLRIPPGVIDPDDLIEELPRHPLPPIVGPTMGCLDLATIIDSFLSTEEEKRLWRHFVAGSRKDVNLTEAEACAAIGGAMSTVNSICVSACKGKSSGRTPLSVPISGIASPPWVAGIGGFSTTVGCQCRFCSVSLDACIDDTYDFDPKYFSTHRTLPSELKTILVAVANGLLDCGWRPFQTKGCCTQDLMTSK